MNIYLDDNRADKRLMELLTKAGHTVVRPTDVGLAGASDARHFKHAIRAGLVVLTADPVDYAELHELILESGGSHSGILAIHYQNDAKRDMRPKHIATAVNKFERSGLSITNQTIVLNHWR